LNAPSSSLELLGPALLWSYVVFVEEGPNLGDLEKELPANPEMRELPFFTEIAQSIGRDEIRAIWKAVETHDVLANPSSRGAD
jgi:hypothetical protein